MDRNEQNIDRVWTLMGQIGIAMIVTHDGHADELRARPMAAHAEQDDNAIYFLTDADAPKDREVSANSNVCVTFADNKGTKFVSVTGQADVYEDQSIVKKIWNAQDKAFWDNPENPRIRVLRVIPEAAEFWEGPGMIVSATKMLVAAATGSRPNFKGSEKVAM